MNSDPAFGPHPDDHSDFEVREYTPVEAWHVVFDAVWDHIPRPWPDSLRNAIDRLEQEHTS